MAFTHLHVHTEYSLLDGACRIEPMLDKIKSMGQTSVAITDHGVMYGVIDFYNDAILRGIKPIIGCEVYVAPRSRFSKEHGIDSERFHLILLCENNVGYQNLCKIVSSGFTEGFYLKPRIDRELLEKYHEGIIALSGCLFGEVSQYLLKDNYEKAKETALYYQSVFGKDNYFLEIQNHGLDDQLRINSDLIKLSRETCIKLVATNDAHYINKEDSEIQQILICIQTNKILGESTGLDFGANEFYLKSEYEMKDSFSFYPEAVTNTQLVADRCNVSFEFGKTKLPFFEVPDDIDHIEWFNTMCRKGLYEKYGKNPPQEYIDRMEYELDVINSMGYTDYYLIVHDFIKYAKDNNIPVGPGRGSGAASICAYCIGITGIDPMKYNLLFERFLNPERVSMPDFDIDFCFERREEVIEYVTRKYGKEKVSQIVTFGTLAAKAAVRDVGRVLGMPYNVVDNVAKLIPNDLNMTLNLALEKSADLKKIYDTDPDSKKLIDYSIKIEGMPRHTSTHAAGVVITDIPTVEYVPLAVNDDVIVTQYTMKALEKLGLLKMDFLGLRTLTVIKKAVDAVKKHNPDFDINNIPIDDKNIYQMFSKGETDGVFQFESAGMRQVLQQLKPTNIEDIIAVLALYRPGPMKSINQYIENKNNPQNIKYSTPLLKPILDVTNGIIVYQEQVMQICRDVAGYTFGRADIVRRAMAKKQHKVMLEEREYFINGLIDENGNVVCEGALRRGVEERAANEIFDSMVSFASYAFNKAHAAAYAFLSYQTAYLKYYYPKELFASMMTCYIENTGKIVDYINACNKLNLNIINPDINKSTSDFITENDSIIFSLTAIKSCGKWFADKIVSERNLNGKFKDLFDFCQRMQGRDLNRRTVECLIKAGAFDNLGGNRHQMLSSLEIIITQIDNNSKRNITGQIGFFDLGIEEESSSYFKYEEVTELPAETLLRFEKEVSGLYLSGHPMKEYAEYIDSLKCTRISDYNSERFKKDDKVKLLLMISSVQKKTTKNNTVMAFVNGEDITGSVEVIIFSKAFETYRNFIEEGNIVLVYGRTDISDNDEIKVICDVIEPVPDKNDLEKLKTSVKAVSENNKDTSGIKKLYLRFDCSDSPQIKVCSNLISIFDGDIKTYYYFNDCKEYKFIQSTQVSDALINELSCILGKDNVILK